MDRMDKNLILGGERLDITPEWVDIQICLITCQARRDIWIEAKSLLNRKRPRGKQLTNTL